MPLGFLRGEDAALHQFRDQRVVGGHLLEYAVPQPVRTRVAHMAERDRSGGGIDERDRHGRPHTRGLRIGARTLPHTAVCLGDDRRELSGLPCLGTCLLESRSGEISGDLPGACTSHAVGYREQRRLEDVGVLIAEAALPCVRDHRRTTDPHDTSSSSVWPTRTTSPT